MTLRDPPLELLEKMLKAVSAPVNKTSIEEARLICRVVATYLEGEGNETHTRISHHHSH
jgi:hypothetical protein